MIVNVLELPVQPAGIPGARQEPLRQRALGNGLAPLAVVKAAGVLFLLYPKGNRYI